VARILVIEDNPINLELMTYLLRSWGHEPLTASDGTSGLAVARRTPVDLIVCDIQMPGGLDGYAVARALKADPSLRDVPLVALTAFAMVGDSDRSLQAGFDRHIAKPIDPERFMAVLGEVLPGGGGSPAASAPESGRAPGPEGPDGVSEALRAPREGLVLLMVDDLASNLEFKQRLLEPAGYEVITATSGGQALDLLHSRHIDLVISDVMMEGGDGFDLVTRLRADPALRHTPFIFLTSTARDSQSQARGLALGADAYLIRPIGPQELLAEVRDELTRPR
jgi:two-component system cell cycle response regulator